MTKSLNCKLLIFLLLICLTATVATPTEVCAETPRWVRVVEDDVPLYTNANGNKVTFILQKSYYLTVSAEVNGYYRVELMSNATLFPTIVGYVKISDVVESEEAPVTPYYPEKTIYVSADSATLKLSPLESAETVITATNTQSVSYYGSITSENKQWYYVYYCGRFGYAEADCFTAPNITMHPTPLPETPSVVPPDTGTTPPDETPADNTAEAILIVFVVVLAVGLVVAVFTPAKTSKRHKGS